MLDSVTMTTEDLEASVAPACGKDEGRRRMESELLELNNRAVHLLEKNCYRNHCPAHDEETLIFEREDEAVGHWRRALTCFLDCAKNPLKSADREGQTSQGCSPSGSAMAVSGTDTFTASATPATPCAEITKKQRSAGEEDEEEGQPDNDAPARLPDAEIATDDNAMKVGAEDIWKCLCAVAKQSSSPERHDDSVLWDAIQKVLETLEAESSEEKMQATGTRISATLFPPTTPAMDNPTTPQTVRDDTVPNCTSNPAKMTGAMPAHADPSFQPDETPSKKSPFNQASADTTIGKRLDAHLLSDQRGESITVAMKGVDESSNNSHSSLDEEPAASLALAKTPPAEASEDDGEACGDYHGVSPTLYIYQRTDYDEGFHTFADHFLSLNTEDHDDSHQEEDVAPTKKRKRPMGEDKEELQLVETLSTICYNVGLLHRHKSCQLENAAICYTTALQLDRILGTSSKDLVRRRLCMLHNIGHVQYCKGRYEDALQTFDQCLDFILTRLTITPPSSDKGKSRSSTWEYYGGMEKCAHFPLEDDSMDSLVYASTLNCIGVLYSHCSRDDNEIALTGTEGALAIYRRQPNAQREVATCLNNLARLHGRTGNTTTDLEMTIEAMEIRRAILGNDHIDVAVMVSNTIITFIGTHRLDEALEMCKEFLRIAKITAIGLGNAPSRRQRRKKKGSVGEENAEDGYHRGHRDVALVLLSMGQIYQSKEMLTDATEALHQALTVSRRAFGRGCDHLTTADILKRLGLVYIDREELEEAQKIFTQELQLRRALQDEPLNVAAVLVCMAQIHEQSEEYRTAIDVYRQVLAMQQEELANKRDSNEDDDTDAVMAQEEVIQTLHNIGRLQYGQRNYHAALGTYQTVLSMERDLRSGDHDDVSIAMTLTSIGIILQCLKEYHLAMESQLEALRIRRNDRRAKLAQEAKRKRKKDDNETRTHIPLRLVDRDPNIAISFYNVGDILEDVGCPSEALTYSLAALSIERATLGEVDSEVVGTLEQVGRLFAWNMQFEEAVPFYEESLRARRIMMSSSSTTCCTKSHRKKKSLEESQRKIVELLVTLAKMYLLQRRIADMMKCLIEAKSLTNQLQQPGETEQDLLWGSGGGGNVQLYHATLLLAPSCAPLA